MKKVAILTGGGDCPGLNPAIYGATTRALKEGYKVFGILEGWKGMIEGYLIERPTLALVVLLVDASVPAQVLDRELIEGLQGADIPLRVVATRVDRLTKSARKPTLARLAEGLGLAGDVLLPVSSKTGENIDVLWTILSRIAARRRAD